MEWTDPHGGMWIQGKLGRHFGESPIPWVALTLSLVKPENKLSGKYQGSKAVRG